VQVRPGSKVQQLVALHDLAATFLHLARARPDKAVEAILEGDGVSIWPTLGGQAVHDVLFCELGYDRAAVGNGLNNAYVLLILFFFAF